MPEFASVIATFVSSAVSLLVVGGFDTFVALSGVRMFAVEGIGATKFAAGNKKRRDGVSAREQMMRFFDVE